MNKPSPNFTKIYETQTIIFWLIPLNERQRDNETHKLITNYKEIGTVHKIGTVSLPACSRCVFVSEVD